MTSDFFGTIKLAIVLWLVGLMIWGCSFLNDYQASGQLTIKGLKAPVKVMRDEKGMAYIYAQNAEDAYMAFGFITAQDRLFQMELTKLFASGRLSELAGEKARTIDIRNRTIGFYRHARRQTAILEPETKQLYQNYIAGVNAYIKNRTQTHHLEFKIAGIKPEPWKIEDSVCITLYLGWGLCANLKTEIVAQALTQKIGFEKAKQLFPVNINPDDPDIGQ